MQFLTYAIIAYVAVSMISTARSSEHRDAYKLLGKLRPRHFLANIPALAAVIVAVILLSQVPGLSWGWFQMFGGRGNVALGATDADGGIVSKVVPMVMISIFAVAAPVLVRLEELMFRAGSEHRTPRRRLAIAGLFGIAHITAGIPIAAAMALSIAGWWFTNRYMAGIKRHEASRAAAHVAVGAGLSGQGEPATFEEMVKQMQRRGAPRQAGVEASSLAHLAWNYTVLGVVVLGAVAELLVNR